MPNDKPQIVIPINLGSNLTRSFSDDEWAEIDRTYIETWTEANATLSRRQMLHKGVTYFIKIDFSPIIVHLEKHYAAMVILTSDRRSPGFDPFPRDDVIITAEISTADGFTDRDRNVAAFLVEYFMYDLLMIVNLSSPAALNVYRGSVDGARGLLGGFRFSSMLFEVCILNREQKAWSPVSFIPLSRTAEWFYAIRKNTSMVATNRAEKAILALMNIIKEDISINTLIWIFYALEGLLDAKPGQNFSSLVSRISLTNNFDKGNSSVLKRKLRNMYDLRSAFVHGALAVTHPMNNEVLDRRAEEKFGDIINACDDGFQIIIAILQKIILSGRSMPYFVEVVEWDKEL